MLRLKIWTEKLISSQNKLKKNAFSDQKMTSKFFQILIKVKLNVIKKTNFFTSFKDKCELMVQKQFWLLKKTKFYLEEAHYETLNGCMEWLFIQATKLKL